MNPSPTRAGDVMAQNPQGGESPSGSQPIHRQVKRLAVYLIALSACFAVPLWVLWKYALHSDFFSYIPLIPVISIYLIWQKKNELPHFARGSVLGAGIAAVAACAVLAGWAWARHSGQRMETEDYLTLTISAYLLFVLAGFLAFLGAAYLRMIAFPLAFLAFMIPMPSGILDSTESFFQYTSAYTAVGMLKLTGMAVFLDDLTLRLPGYAITVAPECSGIHSTMVLLMTALLAGHLFLRSKWKRLFLVAFVVPLAIVRNGFRIFVISELCVRVSHDMIDSPIHHKGGPIFFALSLIPFFWLLFKLRKSELPDLKTVDIAGKA